MNELYVREKGNMMADPQDAFLDRLRQSIANKEGQNWREVFSDITNSKLGEIMRTRLMISGFWANQSDMILRSKIDVTAVGVEDGITAYIYQLDDKISELIDDDSASDTDVLGRVDMDIDGNEKYRKSLKNTALNLYGDELGQCATAVTDSDISLSIAATGPDKLLDWVAGTRTDIVKELWESVKDYRESPGEQSDIEAVNETIDTVSGEMLTNISSSSY